ncbi:probable G protein-coupled receptor 85 [Mya arenaria]|uniref:probable G protein-coupled receptor 85 n=1 Tax=Mya arenaria TaxID=6604 RepID=UPI0022E285C1|nr:probable G protein-coupled receptor 85 [Mya arenaria]
MSLIQTDFENSSKVLAFKTAHHHNDVLVLDADVDPKDEINKSVVIGFLVAIVAVGIIVNSVVIYLIASDRKLHRAPFYFLICIALMDLCKSVFCLPFAIEVVFHDFSWLYSQETCTAIAFSVSFFTVSTALCFLIVAIDRYLFVSSTRFYHRCSHGLVNLAVVIVGWGVSFCLSFPPIFDKDAFKFIPEEMQCTFYHLPYRQNETLGYTICFIAILALILFFYTRLFFFMRERRRMAPLYHEPARSSDWAFFGLGANGQALINLLNGFAGAPNPLAGNARNIQQNFGRVVNLRVLKNEHISRLFFLASTAFIVIWIPYIFQIFVKVYNESWKLSPTFILLSTMLTFSHVAVCPMVCLFFGSPLRESMFRKAHTCCQSAPYNDVPTSDGDVQEQNIRCIELSV